MRVYRVRNANYESAVKLTIRECIHITTDDMNVLEKNGYYYSHPYIILNIDHKGSFEGVSTLRDTCVGIKAMIRDEIISDILS